MKWFIDSQAEESKTGFLYNFRTHFSLCARDCSAFWSPLPPLFCGVDMNDACLCLGQLWPHRRTSSWGRCSICLSSSLKAFPYLFRRRDAVGRSTVPLTLSQMRDSQDRGHCTLHLDTQTLQAPDQSCPKCSSGAKVHPLWAQFCSTDVNRGNKKKKNYMLK